MREIQAGGVLEQEGVGGKMRVGELMEFLQKQGYGIVLELKRFIDD